MQDNDLQVLRREPLEGRDRRTDSEPMAGSGPPPRRRWTTRFIIPGAILAGAAGILAFTARGALRPAVAVRIVPAVARAGVQSVGTAVVQAPGWVEPDPFPVAVTSLADGIVDEVLVLEGQPVKAGQVVARLVLDDARLALEGAEAELRERQAALETARALAAEAQQNWDTPIELRRKVATAEAMLAEKQAELARWPAEVESEKARLAELTDAHERVKNVRAESQGALSEQELVRARQQMEAQRAVLASAETRKPVIEAQVRNLEAEVQAARQDLELRITDTRALAQAKAGLSAAEAAVGRAIAARDEARLRLDRMEVRSPIDGIVMVRMVQPGSKLMLNADMPTSAQVARIYDPKKLQVRVDVPLGDAAKVHVGQAAEVVVGALPDRTFAGEVTRIVHEADIQKNTLQFKVAIREPAAEIKPEMLARVKFLAPASRPAETAAIFVPQRLLQSGDRGTAVWLFDQTRGVAELRAVVPGTARVDDWIEVREGLRPGDWLIADPPADLQPGTAVRAAGDMPRGAASPARPAPADSQNHKTHGGAS